MHRAHRCAARATVRSALACVALAPLVLVALALGSLTVAELYKDGQDQRPWTWLGTLLPAPPFDPAPADLLGRPAT